MNGMKNADRMNKIKIIKKVVDKLINLLFVICMGIVLLLLLQVFCFATFKIPTDSMEPSLLVGDRIVVNKLVQGARIFDVFAALNKEEVTIYRMPGMGAIERNDVLVFNFPYRPAHWDSIAFDVMKYYVKRCVALPGDTLEIRKGFFKIRGKEGEVFGNRSSQERIAMLPDSTGQQVVMNAFPHGKGWTIKEFGPLPIPRRGQVVALNGDTRLLYYQLIEWEQKAKLTVRNGDVLLGDSVVHEYRFRENYYFVAGDKGENSQDSRYWGMLPEPYIVGKASFIWTSKDPQNGEMRWDRMLNKIR